jgi:spore coat protein U-like protein
MRKTLIAAALAALALAGTASAATQTATAELVFTVNPTCNFTADYSTISGDITDGGPGIGPTPNNVQMSGFNVQCNAGTPYTIEADAQAGGLVTLVGDNTAGTVDAYLFQGDMMALTTPFGSLANGEEISGVATGNSDRHDFTIVFNSDVDGGMIVQRATPVADVYRATINQTFTF